MTKRHANTSPPPSATGVVDALRRYPMWSFWIIAFAVAWSIGLTFGFDPDVLADKHSPVVAFLLDRIPKFGFTIAALVVVLAGGVDRREFLARLTRWRVPFRWYLLAVGGPLLAYGIAVLVAPGDKTIEFGSGWFTAAILGADTGLLTYLVTRAGLGEEPGLRGFALPRHERNYSRRRAALVVGVLWGAWHIPVLLDRDTVSIVAFLLSVIALSFVFSWVFHACGGSVLIVALMHAGINAFDDLWERTVPGLVDVDWEVPFFLLTLLAGIAAAVRLKRSSGDESAVDVTG